MTEPQSPFHWEPPPEPGGPAPGVEFAPHGPRLVAYIIDGLIVSIVATLILVPVAILAFAPAIDWMGPGAPRPVPPGRILAFMAATLLVTLVAIAYFPFFWARSGQTPGMRPFGLWVVRDSDGGPIGWGSAILRLVGLVIGGSIFYLGYIWILIDKRRRGWHDLLAGTVVIRRP